MFLGLTQVVQIEIVFIFEVRISRLQIVFARRGAHSSSCTPFPSNSVLWYKTH